MRSLDEEIARRLAEAARSGELEKAESYGKPLAEAEGWSDTPEALRMPGVEDACARPAFAVSTELNKALPRGHRRTVAARHAPKDAM